MAGTIALPQFTADPAHGPYRFGPQAVAPNDSLIVLAIDRTPVGGLNDTPAAAVDIRAEQSGDGGASWFLAVAATDAGGRMFTPPQRGAALITTSGCGVPVSGSGPGRQLRASLTASGAPVTLAGTLTVS